MFIRFVCGEINEHSRVAGGLFCAVSQLTEHCYLPKYELESVDEIVHWFARYMASPFDCLPDYAYYDPAICWFKSTAREHVTKAWELVTILERNDVLIWTIKTCHVGRIYYEDEVQVFARPDRHVKLLS